MVHTESVNSATRGDLATLNRAHILDGFYLAGGTGLALHLGHRESIDLDFFRQDNFNEDRHLTDISALGNFSVDKKEVGTLTGKFESTLLSLFHYAYPLLESTVRWEGIEIASVIDIACMKLDAASTRGTKKDFIDLYAIIRRGSKTLPDLLKAFSNKYASVSYNLMHIKKSLVFFADAESDPMPKMHADIQWEEVKSFFEKEVPKL